MSGRSSPAVAQIDGERVPVTNLGKVLYPDSGFTKGQVIDYYQRIAPVILPHLAGRPISVKRMPDGVDGFAFFEKRAPAKRPAWVGSAAVTSARHGSLTYVLVNNAPTLVWLANRAALELHSYLFRVPAEDRPLCLVFDLDPGEPAGLDACLPLALQLRDLLAELGLQCLAKTSGGKGLHLVVPLASKADFAATKAFALAVARVCEQRQPTLVTTSMAKKDRPGRIFIDWSQNDHGKTTVSVYSLRARPRPTVSAPVTWAEVEGAVKRGATGLVFTVDAMQARLAALGDLFAPALTLKQKLPALSRRVAGA